MTSAGNGNPAQGTAARFGGIEAMFDLMEKSEKSHIWLEAHQQELTERYPDRWIAADQNGLIATASTQAELIENIKEKGINVKTTAMSLLETEPPEMIFRSAASPQPAAELTLPARQSSEYSTAIGENPRPRRKAKRPAAIRE